MPTPLATLQETRARFLLLWVIPILLVGAVAFAGAILNDGDTFWHIAAGRWMMAHGQVPDTDPFTYSFAGQPWMAHEWLCEVLIAGAWLAAGWSGVMLLTALAVGATAAVMTGWMHRWLSAPAVIVALCLSAACLAPSLVARPHILVLPVLALWTVGLLKARSEKRAPSFWLLPLMALAANMHLSYLLAFGVAGAMALEAGLDLKAWRWRTILRWAAFMVGALAMTLLTPHGFAGLAFVPKILSMKTLAGVTEWRGPDFMKLEPVELALLGGLFLLFWRGVKLTAVRAVLLLGLVHMTLQHIRHEVVLGVVAPLILAEPAGRALGALEGRRLSWRMPLPQTALGAGLFAAIVVARLAIAVVRVDMATAPITAMAHVPPALARQPVLNSYDFGGYLIFAGVQPFIDGRTDLFGDAFMNSDDAIQRGDADAINAAIKKYDIRWSIFAPGLPTVAALERAGWTTVYRDKFAVVQHRPDAPPPSQSPD